MDTRTGEIIAFERYKAMKEQGKIKEEDEKHLKEMELKPTPFQLKRMKVGRNNPCPCASGKKFKHCCLQK